MLDFNLLEQRIKDLGSISDNDQFLRGFVVAFEFPAASYDRAKISGNVNAGICISDKLFVLSSTASTPYADFNILKKNGFQKIKARFVVVVNDTEIVAYDKVTDDMLSASKAALYRYVEFFLPLIGIEAYSQETHDPVNVKVASSFAQLYNELQLVNVGSAFPVEIYTEFIIRILFLCFVNSAKILTDQIDLLEIIHNYIGSDPNAFSVFLEQTFFAINHKERDSLPSYISKVKFLDPRIFVDSLPMLKHSRKSMGLICDLLSFDWAEVDPEVFGATIQSIVLPDENNLCTNYTSDANIHKVIGPLFLDSLYNDFEKAKGDESSLIDLLQRIEGMHFCDPSCGAGSFLLVAYREVFNLCIKINRQLGMDSSEALFIVQPDQFFGMDSNSFACQITKLGFLLMLCQLYKTDLTFALSKGVDFFVASNIMVVPPLSADWSLMFPACTETFIFGNTQYKGARKQNQSQKDDVARIFQPYEHCSNLDYSACWFMLASRYIMKHEGSFAFVTTNSLTQGEQVNLLWPKLADVGTKISFAYTSFKWKNDARNRTAVTVVIIGMCKATDERRALLFDSDTMFEVDNISGNLQPVRVTISRREKALSDLPEMVKGNMPYGDGLFIESVSELNHLVTEYPDAKKFIRKVIGSEEFIHGIDRWCIWIRTEDVEEALQIPGIKAYVDKQYAARKLLKTTPKKLLEHPYQFRETNETHTSSLVIPAVSGEGYEYIPIGFVNSDTIVTNLAFVIYDCTPWIFGVLNSRMHNLWARAVCGQHETRTRYSSKLGYNTFPFPAIDDQRKQILKSRSFHIIAARERYPDKDYAKLYKSGQMPQDLMDAHMLLDAAVEACYRPTPFVSDRERLDCLFNLYEEMT